MIPRAVEKSARPRRHAWRSQRYQHYMQCYDCYHIAGMHGWAETGIIRYCFISRWLFWLVGFVGGRSVDNFIILVILPFQFNFSCDPCRCLIPTQGLMHCSLCMRGDLYAFDPVVQWPQWVIDSMTMSKTFMSRVRIGGAGGRRNVRLSRMQQRTVLVDWNDTVSDSLAQQLHTASISSRGLPHLSAVSYTHLRAPRD